MGEFRAWGVSIRPWEVGLQRGAGLQRGGAENWRSRGVAEFLMGMKLKATAEEAEFAWLTVRKWDWVRSEIRG